MPAREPPGREGVRLAQMLAPLSMVTDLARAHPPEEAMRACLVATGLAELLGLSPADRGDVYYTALLRFIGCTATSTLYADAYRGDDVAVRRLGDLIDARDPGEVLSFLWALSGTGPGRVVALLGMARQAGGAVREGIRADCEVAVRLANRTASEIRGEAQLVSPVGSWGTTRPWTRGFAVGPGQHATLRYCVTAPPGARDGQMWWALIKVMYFGRLRYTEAIACSIANEASDETIGLPGATSERR